MLAAVVRQDRPAELQRRGDVGVVRVRLALELAKLGVFTDVDFDLGIAAKAEHASAIVAFPLLQDAADGGGFAVERALHARRKIRDDQQRLGGRCRLDLESRERGGQQQHDQRAQGERDAGTPRR